MFSGAPMYLGYSGGRSKLPDTGSGEAQRLYLAAKTDTPRNEIEKMWYLETTSESVIVGTRGMIRKGQITTLTRYLTVLPYMKDKKLLFAELLISL